MNLAKTKNIKYIPKSFELPQDYKDLEEFAKLHPNKKFVQKHNQHRFVEVKEIRSINKTDFNSFVQEYVSNPLLVDGHKFDIGVYTLITSVNPLRVYIYNGEILFR